MPQQLQKTSPGLAVSADTAATARRVQWVRAARRRTRAPGGHPLELSTDSRDPQTLKARDPLGTRSLLVEHIIFSEAMWMERIHHK